MYFDFEDRRPDTPLLDRPLTRLEQILLTIIAYLLIVIAIIVYPRLPFVKAAEAARLAKLEEQRKQQEQEDLRDRAQFVFVAPNVEIETKVPPKLAELSDRTRRAQTMEKAPNPKNDVAFSRGNSAEKIITDARKERTQPGEKPSEAAKGNTDDNGRRRDRTRTRWRCRPRRRRPSRATSRRRNPTLGGQPSGLLSDAIRNVNKYSQGESLQNVQGNGDFGPSIQFDTKGVEFGPWLRRFIAQIRRNWFVPYAAMSLRGNVVLGFKVHKDGSITDLQIMRPSAIDAFTKSAFNAIKLSNPTVPLPLEFPDENAPFIVTFYFNETPPAAAAHSNADAHAADRTVVRPGGARGVRGRPLPGGVKPRLVAIVGPTATGKSALGIALAERFDGEIVSCDSTAVYRGFDIGTDKVPAAEQRGIPHHLVDVVDPTEEYSAARYAREAAAVIRDITSSGKLPILVGGTGLLLPRADARAVRRAEPRRAAAPAARACRGAARPRDAAPLAGEGGSGVGVADPVRRRETRRPRARGVAADRPSADRPFRRDGVAAARVRRPRRSRCGSPQEETADRVARRVDKQFEQGLLDEIRGLLAQRRSRDRAAVHGSRLPAGARAPARRARRGGDARTDRPREPQVLAAAVDLVQERA